LDAEDLTNLAVTAFDDNWFDSTIRFLRAAKKVRF
jgi:hypothetical protein